MPRLSLRKAGTAAGCDHAHLARAVKAGTLCRGRDGLVELADVQKMLAASDPAMRRKTARKVVTPAGDSPVTPPVGSPPRVTTPEDARDAVRLIEQVLAEEGAPLAGPIDYPAARLAETILKARDKALRIAERRKILVPLEPVKKHIASRVHRLAAGQSRRMPSRHVPEMAARLGVDPGALQARAGADDRRRRSARWPRRWCGTVTSPADLGAPSRDSCAIVQFRSVPIFGRASRQPNLIVECGELA